MSKTLMYTRVDNKRDKNELQINNVLENGIMNMHEDICTKFGKVFFGTNLSPSKDKIQKLLNDQGKITYLVEENGSYFLADITDIRYGEHKSDKIYTPSVKLTPHYLVDKPFSCWIELVNIRPYKNEFKFDDLVLESNPAKTLVELENQKGQTNNIYLKFK